MKIAYLVPTLGIGGVELLVKNIADKLKSLKNDVIIFALDGSLKDSSDNIFHDYTCFDLSFKKNIDLFNSTYYLYKLLKLNKPDILHSHTIKANIFSRIIKYFFDFKLICSEHHTIQDDKKINFIERFVFRLNIKNCDFVTNVSYEAIDSYIKKDFVKVNEMKLIYNGIDLEKFNFSKDVRDKFRKKFNISNNAFCFLGVGRLCEQKNFINLIAAYSNLISKGYKDTKLFIIGEGPDRRLIEKFINEHSLQNKVVLLGAHDNVFELYSAFDCFVLSSNFEGLPTVLIEAIAASRLVIATDCGGVREILPYSPNYIVPPNDCYLLADAMSLMLHLTEKNKTDIVFENLEFVRKNFSQSIMFEKWFHVYKGIIENV